MEQKRNTFFSQNTPFGLLIGGSLMLASYISFRQYGNLNPNPTINQVYTLLFCAGLFIQIRKYRESCDLEGYITYGKAVQTGAYLTGIASVVFAIYTYIFYTRTPEILNDYKVLLEEAFKELYPNSDMAQFITLFTTPFTVAFSEFFSKVISGTIYTLLVSMLLKKKRPQELANE